MPRKLHAVFYDVCNYGYQNYNARRLCNHFSTNCIFTNAALTRVSCFKLLFEMVVTRSAKVVTLEEILVKAKEEPKPEKVEDANKQEPKQKKKTKPSTPSVIIKGKPKSGRIWKSDRKRFSSIVKTKGIRNSFERKQALRQELNRIKEASKAAKEAKVAEKELKKERRRENIKRQEENRKKSEVVQVISNTSKIKKMKKKQLRYIEKRDTTNLV